MTHAPSLDALTRLADPLADRTVAAIMGPWGGSPQPGADALARLSAATRLMAQWRDNASLADWQPAPGSADPALVAILRDYLREGCRLPAWMDRARVARAEAIFMQEGPLSCTLLFCASLPECYVPPQLAEVLHVAGQLEAHTEHRIRQTAAMVFPVMLKGGLTDGAGCGIAQVLKVRLIHATIRRLILHGAPEQSPGAVAARPPSGASGGGHAALHEALAAHGWDVGARGLPCNQFELAYTLLTFHYVFLRGMRTLGLGLPRNDEDAFLHAWNVVGHVLGVRDDLLPANFDEAAASFERMQAFGRAQSAAPDARPGLGKALMQAMAQAIRLPVIRGIPVPLCRWLIGPASASDIGIGGAVPWPTRLAFGVGRALTLSLDRLVRRFSPDFSLSRLFVRVVGYHLLSRFLLDQTRPLGLPDQVLDPIRTTVAAWHDEPRAPAWLNRVEDRWTTTGPWLAGGGPGDTNNRRPGV
jgi:hypothetical protein